MESYLPIKCPYWCRPSHGDDLFRSGVAIERGLFRLLANASILFSTSPDLSRCLQIVNSSE